MFEHDTPLLDEVLMVDVERKPINYHTTVNEDYSIIDPGPGPYLAKWQSGPVLMKDDLNENYFKEENVYEEVNRCIEHGTAVIGHMEFAPAGSIDHVNQKTAFFATLESIAHGSETEYFGDPMAKLYIPIFDEFSFHSSNATAVAVLVSVMQWNDYLLNILPESVHGLVTVLENTCNGSYSYTINGSDSIPMGAGSLHSDKFRAYHRMTSIRDKDIIYDGSAGGLKVDQGICNYKLHIYPSDVSHITTTCSYTFQLQNSLRIRYMLLISSGIL
jgi:hypothetical protein